MIMPLFANLPVSQIWTTYTPDHFQSADGRVRHMCCFLELLLPLLPVPVWLWHGFVWPGTEHLLT